MFIFFILLVLIVVLGQIKKQNQAQQQQNPIIKQLRKIVNYKSYAVDEESIKENFAEGNAPQGLTLKAHSTRGRNGERIGLLPGYPKDFNSAINFNWRRGPILDTGRKDDVGLEFTGYLKVPNDESNNTTGSWYFKVVSDDGIKLSVDGQDMLEVSKLPPRGDDKVVTIPVRNSATGTKTVQLPNRVLQVQPGKVVVKRQVMGLRTVNDSTRSNNKIPWFSKDFAAGTDLTNMRLRMNWRDQGWGGRKGRVFAKLNPGTDWVDVAGLAEHKMSTVNVPLPEAIRKVLTGPAKLELAYVVGGGGGHRLIINNGRLVIPKSDNKVPVPGLQILTNPDGSARAFNRQNPSWKDKFSTEIQGSKLVVKRLDSNSGWGQQLMLRARAPKPHPITGYWRPQGPRDGTVVTKAITLEKDKYYPIQLDWFERGGGATLQLFWQRSAQPPKANNPNWQPVPASSFFKSLPEPVKEDPLPPAPEENNVVPISLGEDNGLTLSYYKLNIADGYGRGDFIKTEVYKNSIDLNTRGNVLNSGLRDNVRLEFTGFIKAPAGTYQFRTRSDDGIKLTVGGTELIKQWRPQGPTQGTSPAFVIENEKYYPISLEWFERGGGATLKLEWKKNESANFGLIPPDVFFLREPELAETEPIPVEEAPEVEVEPEEPVFVEEDELSEPEDVEILPSEPVEEEITEENVQQMEDVVKVKVVDNIEVLKKIQEKLNRLGEISKVDKQLVDSLKDRVIETEDNISKKLHTLKKQQHEINLQLEEIKINQRHNTKMLAMSNIAGTGRQYRQMNNSYDNYNMAQGMLQTHDQKLQGIEEKLFGMKASLTELKMLLNDIALKVNFSMNRVNTGMNPMMMNPMMMNQAMNHNANCLNTCGNGNNFQNQQKQNTCNQGN